MLIQILVSKPILYKLLNVMYNLIAVVVFVCQVRLRAMRSLHQFPPGDLLANENWPELKHSLQKTLKDPNASLSVCCLYI